MSLGTKRDSRDEVEEEKRRSSGAEEPRMIRDVNM